MEIIDVYAVRTDYKYAAVRNWNLDHVWLCPASRSHDWNCFGRGRNDIGAAGVRRLFSVRGNAEWLAAVYDTSAEGRNSERAAAGIVNYVGGVCQNVANRLLAMSEGNRDVSEANGNALVVLAFGKYGADVEAFGERLRTAAERLNGKCPGSVSSEELEAALANVENGRSSTGETEAVLSCLPEPVRGALLEKVPGRERDLFLAEYGRYQIRRDRKHAEVAGMKDARREIELFLRAELTPRLEALEKLLGKELYGQIASVAPRAAVKALGLMR